jgi:hypothetical protein
MSVQIAEVTVTTIADGSATEYSLPIAGKVLAIQYVKAASGSYEDTVDFTITDEASAANLWTQINQTASATKYPRLIGQAGVGTDLTGWYVEPICTQRVKVVLANGGASKTGLFRIVYER